MALIKSNIRLSTNAKALRNLSLLKNHILKVGVPSGAKVQRKDGTVMQVAEYAYYNEFGTVNTPARAAFRITLGNKEDTWYKNIGKYIKDANLAEDPNGLYKALEALGLIAEEDIRYTIEKTSILPRLADETVARKMNKGKADPTKTLVDEGNYARSITHTIE